MRILDAVSEGETPFDNYGNDALGYRSWPVRIERAKAFWECIGDIAGPILDFGCGPGLEVAIGRRDGRDVYGMDCLADWQSFWARLEINESVFLVDEAEPELPDMKFKAIYAIRSTASKPARIAKLFNSLLVDGGHLIVSPKKHLEGLQPFIREDIQCGYYGKTDTGYAYTAS